MVGKHTAKLDLINIQKIQKHKVEVNKELPINIYHAEDLQSVY